MLLIGLFISIILASNVADSDLSLDPQGALRLTGLVDEAMVEKVEKHWGDHILVDSRGGSVLAGLRIAEIISERKMTVTVVDRCYSACFTYLFLPASRREVRLGATLGIHPGDVQSMLLAEEQGVPLAGKSKELALRHAAALSRAGVGMALFRESIRLLRLELVPGPARCPDSLLRPNDFGDATMCQLAVGRFRTWYPTTDQLSRLGIQVFGPSIHYRSLEEIDAKINIANRERPVVFGECEYFPSPMHVLKCPAN